MTLSKRIHPIKTDQILEVVNTPFQYVDHGINNNTVCLSPVKEVTTTVPIGSPEVDCPLSYRASVSAQGWLREWMMS